MGGKRMKLIITADLHLSAPSSENIIEGLPEKLHQKMKVLQNIVQFYTKNCMDSLVVAGDVFHNKSVIHAVAMSSFLDFVRNNRDVKFILMSGNHDMSSRTGEGVSSLKAFDMEPNVKTIHKTMTSKKEGITFIPWDPVNMIGDIKKCDTPYAISHLGLNEAALNSGISIISDIGLKDVSKFDKFFLGHYHKPQEIENTIYVGSIIQEDWGERDDEKRFIVFDTETGNVESIPTTGYRKYFKLTLDKENKDSVIEQAKKYLADGHEVKISKVESIDTSDIESMIKVVDDIELDITNRGITSDMTLVDMMSKYLEIKDIPKESVDEYMLVGKSLVDTYDKKVMGDVNYPRLKSWACPAPKGTYRH